MRKLLLCLLFLSFSFSIQAVEYEFDYSNDCISPNKRSGQLQDRLYIANQQLVSKLQSKVDGIFVIYNDVSPVLAPLLKSK